MHLDRTTPRPTWTFELCDSLETVLTDSAPRRLNLAIPLVGYRGQRVSFQVAYLPPSVTSTSALTSIEVKVETGAEGRLGYGSVELVPCSLLAWDGHDDDYLLDSPGLYPDPIRPLTEPVVTPLAGSWRSLWVDFHVADDASAFDGEMAVEVRRADGEGDALWTCAVPLRIVPAALPALGPVNTQWFHCDGLATIYGVEVFGDEHWAIIEAQVEAAAAIGINSLLTPCWTPPLDTAVGATRLPTQLIGISDRGDGQYGFDFTKLSRWLAMCERHGMRAIEVAHLFTQWGATATPAIWIDGPHGAEQRFGWHVPTADPSYRRLLEQLLPALRGFLAERWQGQVIFHISDEPEGHQIDSYRAARAVVADLLDGAVVADAMSDFELYSEGVVPLPIVATTAAAPFLEADAPDLWLYYCVVQNREVANRFIGMPAHRNRVLGTQLWLAGAAGFLHWGFNFYNTEFSTRTIDPFTDTCAGGGFLAGDSFIVYPGPARLPWFSTRALVFAEAMDDHRALQLLAGLVGESRVRTLVDPAGDLSLAKYPRNADHYRRVWAEVGKAVAEALPRR